jgi:signal transduction histidine kinase
MSEFTDALLMLSREEHATRPADADTELTPLLLRVVEDHRSVVPGKRIAIEIEEGNDPQIAAPESMVAMVIGNIVRNALQHGTGSEVVCKLHGRELTVTNGGALPDVDLSRVPLRRFTTRQGGHGMGLYLVRRICERYRWAIRLENSAGGVLATVGF